MIELDSAGYEWLLQKPVKVGTVNIDERTIETRFACRVEHQLVQYLAGIPGTTEKCIGANARCRQSAIEAEPAQNLRDVGAQDNAGADAREIRALFIDRDREAGALQQPRGRETGKARTENRNPCRPVHAVSPTPAQSP